MNSYTIICPHCHREIPLTETLFHQIRESLRKELAASAKQKEAELARREDLLLKKGREIEAMKESVARQVEEALNRERAALKESARKEAESQLRVELTTLRDQAAERDKRLREAQANEIALRKLAGELEERQKSMDLELARRVAEEKQKIWQSAVEQFSEDHRLKDLEKDKQIEDLRKRIDELKKRAEQGPVQAQGEVLELDMEDLLKAWFPADSIEPVPKGMRGADILQRVMNTAGQHCGTIVWETKRTKAWNDQWLGKLKDDQREINAEIAVIVSEVLPKGMNHFGQAEGVWVTSPALAGNLAGALRALLLQVSQATQASSNKGEKMEMLYRYLSGPAFRQKVEVIVEGFAAMKEDLEKEKRAMAKTWAKREKIIEKVLMSTAVMYGDMQGIIGSSLPEIRMLDLEEGTPRLEFSEDDE